MPDIWYYARDRQRRGPFTFRQFRQMAAAGALAPADMVWNEGASYWVSASEVPGLFPLAAPPLTVPAAPPLPEPPPATATVEPLPQASGGWDLVERGLLSVADGPVARTLPGDRPGPTALRNGADFGDGLALASAPPPAGPARPAHRTADGPSRQIPSRGESYEFRPAQPTSSPRRKLDAMLTVAVALALCAFIGSVLAFVCSFFVDGPFMPLSGLLMTLAGPLFLIVGVPVIVTGHVPYSRGRFAGHPHRSRLEGVAATAIGLGLAAGGLAVLAPSRPKDGKPPPPPLAADSRVTEPASRRPLPAKLFHKDQVAVLQYRGKKVPFALWLPPGTWRQSEKAENPAAEVEFMHKDGEAAALVIAERIQMPVGTLKKAVLENLATVDKDARIVHEETRVVNGAEVLCLTMNAKPEGVPVTFHGYFYAGEQGTVQVMTWTGQNLFQELQPELERFLNGFEVVKKGP